MAEGLLQGVTGEREAWNQPSGEWNRLFMTYHPDGDALDNSAQWFHGDAWLDANGVEVWREVDQIVPVMLGDYALANPSKPSLFLEGSYEYGSYRHECGWVTPVKVRRQFYQTFFAGGAGHTYGAGPVWSLRGDGGDSNCGYTWQQGLKFPGAAQIAGIGKEFLQRHDWSRWVPNEKVLDGGGEGESRKVAVMEPSGEMALVYYADGSGTKIRNTLRGTADAIWFDPRDGQEVEAGAFAKEAVRDMVPPERWEDAILILKTR